MNIRKLLLTALLFVPALLFAAQSWAATYTVTAGTSQQASSGTVSLAPPGGSDQTDKILIIIAGSSSTGATVSTSPSGYTRVDALGELAMFYKLGTGSEGSVNVGFSSGAIAAQIYSIESSTGGWDASPLAGFATRSPATGAEIPYSAMTAVDNGNLRFRVGVKRGNQTGITVSSVALTSGYTSGGFVSRDGLVGGLVLAAEWQEVAGNATDDDAVITTWSTVLNRDGITAEFIPASSGPTVTLSDATPDIDTTVTATLSGAFGAGGNPTLVTFASGDTVACSSATSTTCTFTPAWSDLQPAAGTTFDFADRDLGDLQPYFARTGAQTGVAVDGTLVTHDRLPNLLTNSLLEGAAPGAGWTEYITGAGSASMVVVSGQQYGWDVSSPSSSDRWQGAKNGLAVDANTSYVMRVKVHTVTAGAQARRFFVNQAGMPAGSTFTYIGPGTGNEPAQAGDVIGYRLDVGPTAGTVGVRFGLAYSAAEFGGVLTEPMFYEGTSLDDAYVSTGADNAAPAFDRSNGWLGEEGRTNEAPYSYNLTLSNTSRGTGLATYNASGGILGNGYTALTGLGTPAVNDIYTLFTVASSGAAYAHSLVIRNPNAHTDTVFYRQTNGTAYGSWEIDLSQIGTDWTGIDANHAAVTELIPFTANGTSMGWWFSSSGSNVAIDVAHIGIEAGAFPTSYIPTNGTTATRQPTSLSGIPASVFAPGAGAITNDVATIFSVRPAFPSSATRSSAARLLVLQGDSSNLIDVYTLTTGNTINFRRRAGGADVETATVTVTPGWAAGDELLVAARYTSSGVQARVLHNGVWYTGTTAVGTALSTALANAYVGVDASAANHMTGVFGGLQIWTGADVPSDAELAALTADDLTEALNGTGELAKTQLQTGYTVTLTNGTETSQSTAINIQIPASGYAIVDLTCTAGTDCSDDSEAIVPMIAGDDCAIKVNTGSLNHLSTECAPVFNGGAFSYTVARYDESATAWLAQEEVSVTPPTSCRGIVGDIVFDIVQDILKEMQCVD